MRSLLFLLAAPGALLGCGSSPHEVPDAAPPDMTVVGAATTIEITTGVPAALVAFRDGVAGAWQAATKTSATQFEAVVHGPYAVAVVCDDRLTSPAGTFHIWDTFETGRTLDDSHAFSECDALAANHRVTGHMAQAGTVIVGGQFDSSATTGWDFTLSVPSGTYDLVATTGGRCRHPGGSPLRSSSSRWPRCPRRWPTTASAARRLTRAGSVCR